MDAFSPFDERSSSYLSAKRTFTDFLDSSDSSYAEAVNELLKNDQTRLTVNLNDLRKWNPNLSAEFIAHPMQYMAPFHSALSDYIHRLPLGNIHNNNSQFDKYHRPNYSLGIEGSFGANRVSPRGLNAVHLGQLVCVEGIITRCSLVKPKLQRSIHYAPENNVHTERVHHDATSLTGFPTTGNPYPSKDSNDKALLTEYGLSQYNDFQSLTVQEMPERAPAGLLPSSVEVVVDGSDLVDRCKPGDRVQIIGIYRAIPNKASGSTSGLFRSVLIANNIRPINKNSTGSAGAASIQITDIDAANIRQVSKRTDLLQLLSRSVAPSIYGHDIIKQSLLLLLLGGVEKNLDNGTHIRGDINMLMVGDPSTAKSQLLRFVLNIAPLAINTTGRGSSGVGLTAAVTTDKDTGERRLEAGAMVLADRGIVCIDEFDKMSDADRVAIHEVMEQQTVTIAKAGIHMSLNARCSVVAAANPRYSQYDSSKSPSFNVNLPDSLLSRFDFLFIILDNPDAAQDRAISDRVLSNHRYLGKENQQDLEQNEAENAEDSQQSNAVYQQYDKLLHHRGNTASRARNSRNKPSNDILQLNFLKKYIEFAKSYTPILTEEASAFICDAYSALRLSQAEKAHSSYPVTARALETLIRLSTAMAKCHLRDSVLVSDCDAALSLMKYAIEHDTQVIEKQKQLNEAQEEEKKAKIAATESKEEQAEEKEAQGPEEEEEKYLSSPNRRRGRGNSVENESAEAPRSAGSTGKKARTARNEAVESVESSGEAMADDNQGQSSASRSSSSNNSERIALFSSLLVQTMRRVYSIPVEQLESTINQRLAAEEQFSTEEIAQILAQLESENKVLVRDGVVHRV
jgi:DNA replication licensing factor MCM3